MHVEQVGAVGKHLLIDFRTVADRKLVLELHFGMTGRVDVQALAQTPPKSPKLRMVLETARGRVLGFAIPTIQTHTGDALATPAARLGPDLCAAAVDWPEIDRRIALLDPAATMADALLDQHVAAGIGNVYKSEALFVAGVDPFVAVGTVDPAGRIEAWKIAHEQLRANLRPGRRATTPDGKLWVYDRRNEGCRRCSGPIRYDPAGGRSSRSTYWCARCQGGGAAPVVR
jgi:endonuclease-8